MNATATTEGSPASAGPAARGQFHGTAGSMLPMVMKGIALTFLTLGVYRFWYMTNVRRFLWNNSEVDGDFLEYTGRGVELFIGFLIALAVLVPIYGAIFLVALYAGPEAGGVLNVVATFGIIVLAQYALFRARRYRLTRTVWRGIRFQQSGSGWAYAWRSLLWALFALITLGLAYPFMRASLERYKMTNTWYGDQQGAFSATGGQLFKRFFLLWLIAIVLFAGSGVGAGMLAGVAKQSAMQLSVAHWAVVGVSFLTFLFLAIVLPIYWAIEFRWWADGSSIGPATAKSDLGLFAFLKVYLGYIGVVLLFSLVVGAVGGAAFWAFAATGGMAAKDPGAAQIAFMVFAVIFYFIIALVFAALWQVFGIRPIWRKSLESVSFFGLPQLMAAQSAEPEANAFGEGVADAIDFGGF